MVYFIRPGPAADMADSVVLFQYVTCTLLLSTAGKFYVVPALGVLPRLLGVVFAGLKVGTARVGADLTGPDGSVPLGGSIIRLHVEP